MARKTILLAVLWCLGAACSTVDSTPSAGGLVAQSLYRSVQCSESGATGGSRVLRSREELASFVGTLSRGDLGGPPPSVPHFDPEREWVVVLAMGSRPTAGYGLELASPTVDVRDGTALVRIHWNEPPRDSMQAQVLTNPCVVVSLTKSRYSSAAFADQTGVRRFQTDLR